MSMSNSQYPTTLALNLSQYDNLGTSSPISLNKGQCRLWKCFMQRQTILFLSGVSCYWDLEINHRLRHRLHRCSFIFNCLTIDVVTRFVYMAPIDTITETGSFWKHCQKWSIFKTIQFHLSCKCWNRTDLKTLVISLEKWSTFCYSFLCTDFKPNFFAALMQQTKNVNLDNTAIIISLQFEVSYPVWRLFCLYTSKMLLRDCMLLVRRCQ